MNKYLEAFEQVAVLIERSAKYIADNAAVEMAKANTKSECAQLIRAAIAAADKSLKQSSVANSGASLLPSADESSQAATGEIIAFVESIAGRLSDTHHPAGSESVEQLLRSALSQSLNSREAQIDLNQTEPVTNLQLN